MTVRKTVRAAAIAATLVTLAGSTAALAGAVTVYEYRTIDGTGNNITNPLWGSAGAPLLRESSGSHYTDGFNSPSGASRLSPREISNIVFAQPGYMPSDTGISAMFWQWGQFLDHDLDLSRDAGEPGSIAVPSGDPDFDPTNTGTVTIDFHRSEKVPGTGTGPGNPREQFNAITGFIDASSVYGSDQTRADALREFTGGRLKVTADAAGDLLPFNTSGLPNAGGDGNTSLFLAGDIRCNEQVGLAAIHTLFVREHNYWADRLASENPSWDDETIYQTARKIVGAEVQIVTYDEFLPALLGAYNLPVYSGYDDTIDPTIANAFSTAAYRVGHTMLNESLLRIQADWTEAPEGHLTLAQAFFQPGQIVNHNIDTLLRGMVFQVANTIDNFVINDVRNMLFMNFNGPVPLDLMSLNLNRGREHGLPDFNTLRTDYGLPAYTTFSQINPDPAQVAKLSAAYSSINDMDAWVGLLTEVHLPDSAVGETLAAVIGDQFYRLREGDRFFYLNDPFFLDHATLTRELENTRLSDIIARNTSIDRMTIPDNAFFVCTLEGDADRSGLVSINDLNLVLANWGDNTMPFGTRGDCDGDADVDVDDLNKVLSHWNESCGG